MGMNRIRRVAVLAICASLSLALGHASSVRAQAAAAGQDAGGKQPYTIPEYNAEQACGADKNPASQVKCLDDFVSKYPNSNLLIYVYPMYYQAYGQVKNWAKVIETADKLVALGDKISPNEKYGALYARAFAFNNLPAADQAAQAKGAMAAADEGLKYVPQLKKPDSLDDKAFDEQKKQAAVYLNGTAAQAAMVVKDYSNAIKYYKAVLTLNPDEAITNYRLGQAYLASTPPQPLDGFWYIARAVTSKSATQQQSTTLKSYLRKVFANYQQAGCDNLVDAQMNELLQLAGSSTERPSTYTVPSSADLDAARKDMTIQSVITDLKTGGDKAKITWLASCGLEFPDVPGKLIEITPGATDADPIDLKVAFVTSDAEFQAATTPNMEVKIIGQPEAAKLEKDNPVRFTGTLATYDPDPAFMVHFDKGKVNPEDLPKEKAPAKKPPVKRPAAKKPATP
jgi:tetratricopeptide (TPR) repeat protein